MQSQAIHIELRDDEVQKLPRHPLHVFKPARARACGKLIVVGEHAVVYGAHALAVPLHSMQLNIVLDTPDTGDFRRPHKSIHSEKLQLVLRDALALLKIEPLPLKIEGHSNILFGAGLGASAALSVSILRALSHFFHLEIEAHELALLANQLEKRFHGNPSGLDTTTVALEKPILFRRNAVPRFLQISPITLDGKNYPWSFAIIDSDTRSPTLPMVQQSAPYFTGHGAYDRLYEFDQTALLACQGMESGELGSVQAAMRKAGSMLTDVGVVPPLLQTMMATAEDCGALAAKVTGAGGGGCVLCLLHPADAENSLRKLREQFGSNKVYSLCL